MAESWRSNLGITNVEIRAGTLDAWGQEAESVQVRRASAGGLLPDPLSLMASGHFAVYSSPTTGSGLQDDELNTLFSQLRTLKRDDPKFCEGVQKAEAQLLGHYY